MLLVYTWMSTAPWRHLHISVTHCTFLILKMLFHQEYNNCKEIYQKGSYPQIFMSGQTRCHLCDTSQRFTRVLDWKVLYNTNTIFPSTVEWAYIFLLTLHFTFFYCCRVPSEDTEQEEWESQNSKCYTSDTVMNEQVTISVSNRFWQNFSSKPQTLSLLFHWTINQWLSVWSFYRFTMAKQKWLLICICVINHVFYVNMCRFQISINNNNRKSFIQHIT